MIVSRDVDTGCWLPRAVVTRKVTCPEIHLILVEPQLAASPAVVVIEHVAVRIANPGQKAEVGDTRSFVSNAMTGYGLSSAARTPSATSSGTHEVQVSSFSWSHQMAASSAVESVSTM